MYGIGTFIARVIVDYESNDHNVNACMTFRHDIMIQVNTFLQDILNSC